MNFNEKIERRQTHSVKWDGHDHFGIHPDALPMWVADMDFKTDPAITDALIKEAATGIYGYTLEPKAYADAIIGWMERRHGWRVLPEWIMTTPGVVSGLNAVMLALTKPGDSVLIQEPVYYPFKKSIETNGRIPVSNDLVLRDGHYEIDFEDLEKQIREHQVKLFILCSPHNPVGRVWNQSELNRIVDLCKANDVIILSDEIHMDFVFKPNVHTVLSKLRPDYADKIVILSAASKTFNLAGFKVSQLITSNMEILKAVKNEYLKLGIHSHNTMGMIATQRAYAQGDAYVDALVAYIEGNIQTIDTFLKRELPQLKLIHAEGLYLLWIDFRALGKTQTELVNILTLQAKLWFNDGATFGNGGSGFMRVNVATPRDNVEEALQRLKATLSDTI